MIGPACDRVPLPEADREAITAWRRWFVLPEEYLLRPIYKRGLAWKPREALEAVCPWTFAPPKGLDPLPGVLVVGQISMWGRLIEHEHGWRSSHAYPKHLYAFTEDAALAAALRDTYLVPVEYGDKAQALAERLPAADAYDEPAPAAASPPAPPARPTAPPAPPDYKAPFRAVIEGMRADSALKGLATMQLDRHSQWFYQGCRPESRASG
jgi:hypothetical protein